LHAGQPQSHAHLLPGLQGLSSPLELLEELLKPRELLLELLELLLEDWDERELGEDCELRELAEEWLEEDGIARPLLSKPRRTQRATVTIGEESSWMAGRAARTDLRRFGHADAATTGEKHLPRAGLCAGIKERFPRSG
jgi:hypothetical protein